MAESGINDKQLSRRLVASIVQFLGEQISSSSGDLGNDAKESLEVAIQCLESAYDVSSSDAHLLPSQTLLNIFREAVKNEPVKTKPESPVSEEAKAEAERLKNEGNNLMKAEKFEEALKCYTDAIKLDGKNAVFYCNRAAAYSKLNNHSFALEDCRRAIEMDPNYSKAYGRMGLAYASLNDHYRARDCYKKATELDPANESYRNNLSIAEEKVAEIERSDPLASLAGGLGNFDLGSVLQNPALMQMASTLMADPAMQSLVSNVVGNLTGAAMGSPTAAAPPQQPPPTGPPPTAPAAGPTPTASASSASSNSTMPPPNPLTSFLEVGRQFAEQMQQSNPELINQLRQRMAPPGSGNGSGGGSGSAPGSNSDDKTGGDKSA